MNCSGCSFCMRMIGSSQSYLHTFNCLEIKKSNLLHHRQAPSERIAFEFNFSNETNRTLKYFEKRKE